MVDDGRTTEHGYTISSPCEPDGSGELKILWGGGEGVEETLCYNRVDRELSIKLSLSP